MYNKKLFKFIFSQYLLGKDSIHGPSHWKRVERNGLAIANINGGDKEVIRLFAILHDSQRENEGYDLEHGPKAAKFCISIRNKYLKLTDKQFEKLCYACKYHTSGRISKDKTIGACWDADRLDLPRVGIIPHTKYMSTKEGKRKAELMQENKKNPIIVQNYEIKSWWKFW